MTNEEIVEFQKKERAFLETPIGKAFHRFKTATSRYWQADGNETISPRRLMELSKAEADAEHELRALIEPLALTSGMRETP